MKKLYAILLLFSLQSFSQDFVRIGATHDFKSDKVVQTFSFDYNRTESADEKLAHSIFLPRDMYIAPTADVNIGDGVTSSENNVLAQIQFGKGWWDEMPNATDGGGNHFWNYMLEVNPSYNSDKLFEEKLVYGQVKFAVNFISTKHNRFTYTDTICKECNAESIQTVQKDSIGRRRVHTVTGGVFYNNGYRFSKTYDNESYYSTLGILLDYKTRFINKKGQEKWICKLSGNYYRIFKDVSQITNDGYGGIIKTSVDRHIAGKVYVGTAYKFGNDNPFYKYINTLELSLKVKY